MSQGIEIVHTGSWRWTFWSEWLSYSILLMPRVVITGFDVFLGKCMLRKSRMLSRIC